MELKLLFILGSIVGVFLLFTIAITLAAAYIDSFHREHTSSYQNSERFTLTLARFEEMLFSKKTTKAMKEFFLEEVEGKMMTVWIVIEDVYSPATSAWGYGYEGHGISENNWQFTFPLSFKQFQLLEKGMQVCLTGKIGSFIPEPFGNNERAMKVWLRGTIIETEQG